ncbi:hypothetical protein [Pseudomonas sp. N040]|uniref:hypothetical protein n=1 Tax=Pseudomonas sp. N040 TaxID=2785325 RepID=UPI0018A2B299|nr:hypothetical protein [Pseudomonas sp. N040]MBF7729845.1 hypothetical protein [Pseudomonas sp. N040]MBW7013487.1 hypothetical protein [Pseudomonas sp. N040]
MSNVRNQLAPVAPWLFAGVFCLFCLAFYLPLSSKATNNVFYVGLALPTFIWLLARPRALMSLWRPFAWLFVLLSLMVTLDASDVAGLKKALYLLLFFASCVLLEGGRPGVQQVFSWFALASVGILLWVAVDWLWIWLHGERWVRYVYLLGVNINPVYVSLLITSALVFLWLFHVSDRLERHSRAALVFGLLVLAGLVVLCSSIFQARSALLGFGLFFTAYCVTKRMLVLGLALLVLLAGLLFFLGGAELLLNRGLSHRTDIWQDAWQRLTTQCNVWLGCGADDYLFLGKWQHPHSGYFSMLYRNGVLGALLFALFAAVFFWQGIRARSRWMLLALVGWGSLLTTTNGVLTSPQPLWVYFWLPTFMAIIEGQQAALQAYYAARRQVPHGAS